MRIFALFSILVVLAGAQGAFFECQVPNSLIPPFGSPDCEGLTSNAAALGVGAPSASIRTSSIVGMPTQGQGFLSLGGGAAGVTVAPAGGPLPRPLAGPELEVRVPIPFGTSSISITWAFSWWTSGGCYVGPGPIPGGVPVSNDGIDITIVDAWGVPLLNLVYADTTTQGAGVFPTIQTVSTPLPVMPIGAYLSVAVWDGAIIPPCSNNPINTVYLDAIAFIVPSTPFTLSMSSPAGPGSLQLDLFNGLPSAQYVTLLTSSAGNFPTGATAGLDILPGEIATQLLFGGPPFSGSLDLSGSATFAVGAGALPMGMTVYGVSAMLDPTASFVSTVASPLSMTVP